MIYALTLDFALKSYLSTFDSRMVRFFLVLELFNDLVDILVAVRHSLLKEEIIVRQVVLRLPLGLYLRNRLHFKLLHRF